MTGTTTTPSEAASVRVGSRRPRLLLLDDQPSFRGILGDLLQMESYDVRAVSTGGEAIGAFDSWTPDVLVFDRRLDEEDGFDVARRLKARDPSLGTILITGIYRGEQGGDFVPDATLLKPFEFSSLVLAIEDALRTRAASSTQ